MRLIVLNLWTVRRGRILSRRERSTGSPDRASADADDTTPEFGIGREPGSSVLELAGRSHGNAATPPDQSRGYFPLPSHVGSVADQLSPTCVLSIPRSQGSEFPCVIVPLHRQHCLMLQRKLLCTAVTRGGELVVLVGSRKILAMAAWWADAGRRYAALRLAAEVAAA